jgi:hypothetical protein
MSSTTNSITSYVTCPTPHPADFSPLALHEIVDRVRVDLQLLSERLNDDPNILLPQYMTDNLFLLHYHFEESAGFRRH